MNNANGCKVWYVADGWIPLKKPEKDPGYVGHESLMILNYNDTKAKIYLDIFFEDKDPIENIELEVLPKRIKCFRMDMPEDIGGAKLNRLEQYGLRIRSSIGVVIQFGRMDITQPNLAYMGYPAFPGQ
ncbi:MAG: sensory rhodopsin transducer [Actinomycetota bacterium]